jgi:integrase
MEYLKKEELRNLMEVAHKHNERYHLALLVALWHGLRISELINIRGTDVDTKQGTLIVQRLKGSLKTTQPIHVDADPLFDESPILALAKEKKGLRLFEVTRQNFDLLIKKYGREAGIHEDKLHMHALKHSIAMILWDATHSLGQVRSFLGHKAASSTMAYLVEADAQVAQKALANISI